MRLYSINLFSTSRTSQTSHSGAIRVIESETVGGGEKTWKNEKNENENVKRTLALRDAQSHLSQIQASSELASFAFFRLKRTVLHANNVRVAYANDDHTRTRRKGEGKERISELPDTSTASRALLFDSRGVRQ